MKLLSKVTEEFQRKSKFGEINLGKDYRENDINKIINNLYSTNFENIEIQLKNNVLKIKLEYPVIINYNSW